MEMLRLLCSMGVINIRTHSLWLLSGLACVETLTGDRKNVTGYVYLVGQIPQSEGKTEFWDKKN